jgi:hypothetical protein
MDRLTKATLRIAFLVLLSYFGFFYMDCAMDDDCHLVCPNPPRRASLRCAQGSNLSRALHCIRAIGLTQSKDAAMHVVVGLALAAIVFLIPSKQSQAASAAVCDVYAKESAAKAQGIRQFDCGYDLKEPRWTTDLKDHARWCRANPEKTVATETASRRGEIKLCGECRAYARFAVESAAENSKRNCGLSGPRWNDKASDHFAWCMALRNGESAAGADIAASYKTIAEKIDKSTYSETLERMTDIAKCKSPKSQ